MATKFKNKIEDITGSFAPKISDTVDTVKKGVSDLVSGAKDTAVSIGEVLGTGTNLGQMASSQKNMAKYEADETDATANLNRVLANEPGEYQESEELTNIKGQLTDIEGKAPTPYENKYEQQIDNILDQMLERGNFSYDYSTDPTWLALKDQYQRNAMLGMQSAMGDAAGLTGGYASSYAQHVGQQTYQQSISEMTDIIPELHGQALNEWQAENQQLASNLSALQTQSELDYAQFYNDWQIWNTDRNYLYNKVINMSNDEFNKYIYGVERWQNDRAYYAEQKQLAIQNQQWQLAQDESRRQFNQQLAFNYINMGVNAAVDLTTTGMQVGASLIDTGADFALGLGGLIQDGYQFNKELDYKYYVADLDDANADADRAQADRHHKENLGYDYYKVDIDDANADADREQADRHHNENITFDYTKLGVDNANADADRAERRRQFDIENEIGDNVIKTQGVDDPVIETQGVDETSAKSTAIPKYLSDELTWASLQNDGGIISMEAIDKAYNKGDITTTQAAELILDNKKMTGRQKSAALKKMGIEL